MEGKVCYDGGRERPAGMWLPVRGWGSNMGKKRVSMRQIAKECGCSLATVSYALNHSGQAKISSATRLRIIETAKRLNYSPRRAARSRPARAAILVSSVPGQGPGRRAALMDLAGELTEQLARRDIPAVVLELEGLAEQWRQVQKLSPGVLFMLDRGSGGVAHLDPPCVQPIIFVDSDNDDPLYYKVLPDYPSLIHRASELLGEPNPFLMLEGVRSGGLLKTMTAATPPQDAYLHLGRDMGPFLEERRDRKGVVVGDLLAVEVCRRFPPENLAVISALDCPELFPPELTVLSVPNRARAAAAVEIAMDLMSLDYDSARSHRVLLGSEG